MHETTYVAKVRLPDLGHVYLEIHKEPLPVSPKQLMNLIHAGLVPAERRATWEMTMDQVVELRERLLNLLARPNIRRPRAARAPDVVRRFIEEVQAEAAA